MPSVSFLDLAPDGAPTADRRTLESPDVPTLTVDDPDADGHAMLRMWVGPQLATPDTAAATVVTLVGELCTYSTSVVRGPLHDAAAHATNVVIDVAGLSFIDTTGLHLLEQVHTDQRDHAGSCRVHRPSPAVERLLSIIELSVADL